MLEFYHHELLNFLTRHVKDRDTAADLAQESCLRILTLQQAGHVIQDLRALLYRTARNLVVDQYRRTQVRQHDELDALAEDQLPSAPRHLQPEEAVAAREHVNACLGALDGLPPRCREAMVLHLFEELPHAQIADRMGISVSMVEKHLVRGLLTLRQTRSM